MSVVLTLITKEGAILVVGLELDEGSWLLVGALLTEGEIEMCEESIGFSLYGGFIVEFVLLGISNMHVGLSGTDPMGIEVLDFGNRVGSFCGQIGRGHGRSLDIGDGCKIGCIISEKEVGVGMLWGTSPMVVNGASLGFLTPCGAVRAGIRTGLTALTLIGLDVTTALLDGGLILGIIASNAIGL